MNWEKTKEADEPPHFHAHLATPSVTRSDKVQIYVKEEGLMACCPDDSHYLRKWTEILEGLPEFPSSEDEEENSL